MPSILGSQGVRNVIQGIEKEEKCSWENLVEEELVRAKWNVRNVIYLNEFYGGMVVRVYAPCQVYC